MSSLRSADRLPSVRFSELLAQAEAVGLDLESSELPVALGELERVRARLTFRALSAAAPSDVLLTVGEAVKLLGMAEGTLYRRAADYPFTVRDGRRLRFSRAGIERFIRAKQGGV